MTDFPCLSHFVGLSYLHYFLETLKLLAIKRYRKFPIDVLGIKW